METKQFSRVVFAVLTVVIHFVVVLALSSNVLLSDRLSETLPATALGFFLGKVVTRNARRTWVELGWFPALNVVGTLLGAGVQGAGVQAWTLAALGFAFAVSATVFAFVKRPIPAAVATSGDGPVG